MNKQKRIRIAVVAAAVLVAGTVTVFASGYDSMKDPIVSLSYLTDVFKPELSGELKASLKTEISNDLKSSVKTEVSNELKSSIKNEITNELKSSLKTEIKNELGESVKNSITEEIKTELESSIKDSLKETLRTEIYNEISGDFAATIDALQKQIDVLKNEYEVVTLEKGKKLTANASCEIVVLSGSASVKCSATDKGIVDCTDGVMLYDGQSVPLNHKLLVPDNGDGRGMIATSTTELLIKGGYKIG